MYRTGDRARRLPGTEIQFLGRVDQQVKLRGYRVEPAEIEAALLLHPSVREAAVVPRHKPSGEKFLAAYYVARDQRPPDTAGLRGFLRERLPDYMVPSAFVPLDALPLSPSGKLDRLALPAAVSETAKALEEGDDAPRTPTEQALERIWCEVLETERAGLHDSFFDLGGHSLLATRLVLRVNDAFGLDLTLRTIFEHPTIAALAEVVDAAQGDVTRPRGPAVEPLARRLVTLPAAPGRPE